MMRVPALRAALTVGGFLALAMPSAAQSGRMAGKVLDEQGQPVPGVVVSLELTGISASGDAFSVRTVERGQRWQAKTNENGDYALFTLPSGRYVVTAAKDGLGVAEIRTVLAAGDFGRVNLILRTPAPRENVWCAPTAAIGPLIGAPPVASGDSPQVVRLLRWLEAVQHHVPGCIDAALTEVRSWSRPDLEMVFTHVGRLAIFLQEAGDLEARGPVDRESTIEIGNRSFTIFEVRKMFRGNETLKRGAVLHADIAAFVRDDFSRRSVFVQDGQQRGVGGGTAHWGFGRRLLDSVRPSPRDDEDALLWYRAASAYLFREGLLSELPAHLDKARRAFPGQSVFLVDSAYLHQKFASPPIQSAVTELRGSGIEVAIGSRGAELRRAEHFLRQALAVTPDDAGILLRLGYTLGELGRHEQAAAELRRAIAAGPDRPRRYLAELFLGREEQALGRRIEAQRRFENAAQLYPHAQSPWLALSHLARQHGDRAGALRALQQVTVRRPAGEDEGDPRRFYFEPHLRDALPLMDQMRTMGRLGR